jgi:hypothetical protein
MLPEESGLFLLTTLDCRAWFWTLTIFCAMSSSTQSRSWHRPIVITGMSARLGDVIGLMKMKPEHPEDDVIDHDLILVWGTQKRIITGADLLGRLLRRITTREVRQN